MKCRRWPAAFGGSDEATRDRNKPFGNVHWFVSVARGFIGGGAKRQRANGVVVDVDGEFPLLVSASPLLCVSVTRERPSRSPYCRAGAAAAGTGTIPAG